MNYVHVYRQPWEFTVSIKPLRIQWISLKVLAIWLLLLGTASIIVSSADSFALPFNIPINSILGWALFSAGIVESAQAIFIRRWPGCFLIATLSILHILFGAGFLIYPIVGLDTSLRFLVGFLACSGALKLLLAARLFPFGGWERIAFNGYTSLILAFFLLLFIASMTDWVLGLILGLDLIFYAGWLVMRYVFFNATAHKPICKKNLTGSSKESNVIYYNFIRD